MATAKKTTAPKKAVRAEFLNSFTSELENATIGFNGYGELKSAIVESDDNGVKVTAIYTGREWEIEFQ